MLALAGTLPWFDNREDPVQAGITPPVRAPAAGSPQAHGRLNSLAIAVQIHLQDKSSFYNTNSNLIS